MSLLNPEVSPLARILLPGSNTILPRLRLDVDIEALELALVLDSTKCRCLDVLGIGIGNHLQCQEVLATTAPSHPQYKACTLRIGRNWR